MASSDPAGLPGLDVEAHEGTTIINERCRLETVDGHCVVTVGVVVLAHYVQGDRMAEAYAMVCLVEQGWAQQVEVARAYGCAERTVRRHQRRFEKGGLAALGRRDVRKVRGRCHPISPTRFPRSCLGPPRTPHFL